MQPKRLFDFIYYQLEHCPQEKAIGYFHEGSWKYYSTKQIIDLVNKASRGLLKLGLQPGDKVSMAVYKNRLEWCIMDLAIMQIGCIDVPVYPTISPREYEYIFNDAGVKHVFVGADDLYDKVTKAQKNVPTLERVYTFDKKDGAPFWEDIFTEEGDDLLKERMASVDENDLATLIYTSGTTGNPKGVMLSHKNICSNVDSVKELIPIGPGQIALSFLPLCHIFERTASYSYYFNGCNIVFTGTDNLGGDDGDLRLIKPHFFTTVPRLLEKVYEKIFNKGLALTGAKKKLFFWALSLTEDYSYESNYSGWSKIKRNIADKLIFSKWREALGGRVVGILTGAAPCPEKMARVFSAANIPIREGYGLTETSPGLAINRYTKNGALLGTVGPALKGVELMIDTTGGDYREGEGEILAAGSNIMLGYYNKPDKTAEVFKDINGKKWFCTGDIGTFVKGPEGKDFLKITDRKKELLKTSGGKYVAPAPIESKLKESFLVEQVMVIGDKQKYVSALILPAREALLAWAKDHGLASESFPNLLTNSKTLAKFQEIIDETNPLFGHVEQIKKFKLLDAEWGPSKEDGTDAELTPTLKLKRRVIRNKHAAEIDSMYSA